MTTPDDIKSILESFVDEFNRAIGSDARMMERILIGGESPSTSDLSGTTPESWTEEALINPLLDEVGLNKVPGRPSSQRETPDFRLEEECGEIVGENKALNGIELAESELVEDYISKKSWSDYGIATDGLQWVLYRAERGGDFTNYDDVRRVDLRPVLRDLARRRGYIGQQPASDSETDAALQEFVDVFAPSNLVSILTEEAPRRFRYQRQRQVDEFYELYIELIFGESDEYDDKYETCLRDDIVAPAASTEKQNDVFAITLVNRLLFIKFLETRTEDILPEGFLQERVDDYNENIPGTLYKTIIEPLFYDLFNTPQDDRRPDHHQGWFADIPYLNGGLFRQNVENEDEYDVHDRTLPTLIIDLIEGTELDLDLDPAILGSVFEKTINHLSESENRQQEMGAFYTPNDVTRLVNDDAVDPKIRDEIIKAYTEELSQPAEFQAEVEEMSLEEMLLRIEDGAGWFGNNAAMEAALRRISNLKVIDPACGSGHFLTAAMEEMHQVQSSLHRGLNGGDNPTPQEQYKLKKNLALDAIYGVDVDRVATEIAKLRVWLKIIEGNGWGDGFSRLPNIDVNIVSGNSLIGLPAKSSGQTTFAAFDVELDDIEAVRQEYKNDQIGREQLSQRIDELRPELQDQYINQLNHYVEQRIESREEWDSSVEFQSALYPVIRKVTVRDQEENELTTTQKRRLEDAGFYVEPRYEKSAKVEEEDVNSIETAEYGSLLDDGFILEVKRQPTRGDLKSIDEQEELSSGVFHWVVEFPEAVVQEGSSYEVNFDIVVGNPPYGDVLSDTEKMITAGYNTGSINDIAAQFVERQVQIIDDGGYFGNILTLRIVYQRRASAVRDVIRDGFENTKIACFTRRPSQVFADAQPRTGIFTGRKRNDDSEEERSPIQTSRFLRFDNESREEVFRDINYRPTDGLVLGEKIGSGEDYSLPKLGDDATLSILRKLKDHSHNYRVIRDAKRDEEGEHVIWRRRGTGYWMNPLMENLYPEGETPTSLYPMYFDSELEAKTAFIIQQSSLYYVYWMVYKNGRNIDWMEVDAFPFPTDEQLEDHADELEELADELWDEMSYRFVGGMREVIRDAIELKPIVDDVDDLLGPIFGLSEEEVEYVKAYDTEYGRSNSPNESLEDYGEDVEIENL